MEKRKTLPFFGISRRIFAVEKFPRSPEMSVEKTGWFSAKTRKQFLWVLWVFVVWVLWKNRSAVHNVNISAAAKAAISLPARRTISLPARRVISLPRKRQFSRPRIGRAVISIFGDVKIVRPVGATKGSAFGIRKPSRRLDPSFVPWCVSKILCQHNEGRSNYHRHNKGSVKSNSDHRNSISRQLRRR